MLLGIAFTLIFSTISAYTSFFGLGLDKNMNAIFSIFLVILGLSITDRIATILYFDDRIEKLSREVTPSDAIEIFASPEIAINYFINIDHKVRPISRVRNTVFKCDVSENESVAPFTYETRDKLYQKKKILVEDNVQWNDLGVEFHHEIIDEFLDWSSKKSSRKYFWDVVDNVILCVNFLHITYTDNSQEVLIGWSYSYDNPSDGIVFRSNNDQVCKYFLDMFRDIQNDARRMVFQPEK